MSFTILIVLLHLQTTYFGFIYPAIILTLLLLTFYIIRSKISVVTDPHYIRTELLYTIESSGTLYAISCIVYMLVPSKYLLLPHILCTSMGHGFAIYFACGWAIKRLKLLQSPHNLTSEVTHSAFVSAFHDHKTICFDDIVSHRIGIESFCAHLAEEYSLDSMLFIIESCQFKAILHALHSNVALSDNKEEEEEFDSIMLPTDQSNVFGIDNILNHEWLPLDPRLISFSRYKFALHLYDKYIDNAADFCINISSSDRRDIYKTFKQLYRTIGTEIQDDIDEPATYDADVVRVLFNVFNKAISEIWHLLGNDSFFRFRSTSRMNRLLLTLYPKLSEGAVAECRKHSTEERREAKTKLSPTTKEVHSLRSTTATTYVDSHTNVSSVDVCTTDDHYPLSPLTTIRTVPTDRTYTERTITERSVGTSSHTQRHRAHSVSLEHKESTVEVGLGVRTKSLEERGAPMREDYYAHVVPSDIIKTVSDFWRTCIHGLSKEDRVEIGCAIYLSMLATDRSMKHLFKRNFRIRQEQIKTLSMKFLDMICWLIQSLWKRDDSQNATLVRLGVLHRNLQIQIVHFKVMITAIHEQFAFYFAHQYRLQEQYAMDYIMAYSTEMMMDEPLVTDGAYFKRLKAKHGAQLKKNITENLLALDVCEI